METINMGNKDFKNWVLEILTPSYVPVVLGVGGAVVAGIGLRMFKPQILKATRKGYYSAKADLSEKIRIANKNFEVYQKKHEEILNDIQKYIGEINKKKPIIKDYILKELSLWLNQKGKHCDVGDYDEEYLDQRMFPIVEDYNVVKKKSMEIENALKSDLYAFYFLNPVWGLIRYLLDYRKIKKISEELKDKANGVLKDMQTDLGKMEDLKLALKNVSSIFKDLSDLYIPFIKNVIKQFESSELNNIPDDIYCRLHSACTTLSQMAEKRIIQNNNISITIESCVEYSNWLSEKYNELKVEWIRLPAA